MAASALYSFSVTGKGRFPIDMLRYDSCYPASESDSNAVERSNEKRTVKLLSVSRTAPTRGRWASFMWSVDAEVKA